MQVLELEITESVMMDLSGPSTEDCMTVLCEWREPELYLPGIDLIEGGDTEQDLMMCSKFSRRCACPLAACGHAPKGQLVLGQVQGTRRVEQVDHAR